MSFKILKNNCCGLDVHKTWIFACIGITDSHNRTEYKQARFSSFTKGLQELCDWLAKYNCTDVCMESTGKYWIPVFNILEKNNIWVTLSHPKYTKPQKGNKTDRKDAKWICDLYMCGMVKPSFIPPACTSQQKLDTNFTFFFSKYPTTVQCYASFVSLLVADWIVSGASRLSSLLVYCLCGFGLDNRSSSDIIEARRPSGINLY